MPSDCVVIDSKGRELNEQDVKNCLDELRTLVETDEELNKYSLDDPYLLRFLHACGFHVRWAYKRMKAFWKMVVECPDWFQKGGPLEYKEYLESQSKVMCGRDREGRILYTVKLGNVNPNMDLFDAAHLDDIWIESVIDDPTVQEKGIAILVDVSNVSWKLLRWGTPHNIGMGLRKLELYPLKDIIVHVVNTSFLVNAGIKVLFPFLNAKMKERIKFHFEDMDSLHEHISPDQLPEEYGGNGDIDYNKEIQILIERNKEISEKMKYYNDCSVN